MPLRTCPSCQRDVSTKATACPHCGDPLKVVGLDSSVAGNARSCMGCVLWSVIVGFVLVVIGGILSSV